MRRFITVLLAIAASLAIPAFAFAFFSKPSDLLQSAYAGLPMDFSVEAHGGYEGGYASLWMSGSSQGKLPQDVTASLKATVDVQMPQEQTMRVKLQIRVADKKVYALVDSIEGPVPPDVADRLSPYVGKTWLMTTLPDNQATVPDLGMSEQQVKDWAGKIVDAALSLERITSPNQVTYSLALRPDAAMNIVQVLGDLKGGSDVTLPTPGDISDLQNILSHVNFHANVQTDANGQLQSAKQYLSVDYQGFTLVIQGTGTVRSTPVTVDVPQDALNLDEQLQPYEGSSASSSSEPSWNTGETPSTASYLESCPGDTPAEQLGNLRKGVCTIPAVKPPRSR